MNKQQLVQRLSKRVEFNIPDTDNNNNPLESAL